MIDADQPHDKFQAYRADRCTRLSKLAGRHCPICRRQGEVNRLVFDGSRLRCPQVHSWSNPDAAEEEINPGSNGLILGEKEVIF